MKYLQNIKYSRWLWFFSLTHYNYIFILNLTIITNGLIKKSNENCTNILGWISPANEVIIRVGQPLEVFCSIDSDTLEAENYNSTNLSFQKDKIQLEMQNVTKVNETTVCLYLQNENESVYLYECFLKVNKIKSFLAQPTVRSNSPEGNDYDRFINNYNYISAVSNNSIEFESLIGFVRVVVGDIPKKVKDFKCILYLSVTLKCSWEVTENYFKTNYSIQYIPVNSPDKTIAVCPNDDDIIKHFCQWTPLTNPPYTNRHENLNVTITGANIFGKIEQSFIFNQFELIKPHRISNLYTDEITSASIMLGWHIDDLLNYSENWTYEIKFKGEDDHDWFTYSCNPEKLIKSGRDILYNVTELGANMNYIFRIRVKSSLAPQHEEYWSPYCEATFQTKPLLPTYVPETDINLFKILHEPNEHFRTVFIYWRPLKLTRLYGKSFHYEIMVYEVDENGYEKFATKVKQIFKSFWIAKYKVGPSAYRFVIRSVNSEGQAHKASSINVPAANNVIKSHPKFYILSYLNRTFEYFWQPPNEKLDIVNYTLFQYSYLEDSEGGILNNNLSMQIIHLPSNITRYKLFVDFGPNAKKIPAFISTYISANTNKSSTGLLHWEYSVHSVSDYFKSEKYAIKVKKSKKFLKRKKIQRALKNSSKTARTGWKFSEKQYQKWLNKLLRD